MAAWLGRASLSDTESSISSTSSSSAKKSRGVLEEMYDNLDFVLVLYISTRV